MLLEIVCAINFRRYIMCSFRLLQPLFCVCNITVIVSCNYIVSVHNTQQRRARKKYMKYPTTYCSILLQNIVFHNKSKILEQSLVYPMNYSTVICSIVQ